MPGEQIWFAAVPPSPAPPPQPPEQQPGALRRHPATAPTQIVLLHTRAIVEVVAAADRELPRICLTLESVAALAAGLLAQWTEGNDPDELDALLEEQQRILDGAPRFVRFPQGIRAPIGTLFEVGGIRLESRGTHWVARGPYVQL